jgi:Ca2+-binding EF-hand superfamily protein
VCGIFLVHGVFSVIAVAMGLIDWFDRRMRPPAAEEFDEKLDVLRSQIIDEKELLALFNVADIDGSGMLDKAELAELLKSICHTVTPEEIKHATSILDVDGDDCISFAEFVRWWRREGPCE